MTIFKQWVKLLYIGFGSTIVVSFIVLAYTYILAYKSVELVFPDLVRIVAEDNCLDNTVLYDGKTMYESFEETLEAVSDSNPVLEFRSDAINVPYLSRDTAPQKGAVIPVSLKGYWVVTLPLAGGIDIDFPIERHLEVTGIRYYRDR